MKYQFKFYLFLILFSLCSFHSIAQKTKKTAKFHIGIEAHGGATFPNFLTEKEIWKPTIYVSGGISFSVLMRFNRNWSGELGLSLEQYTMRNRMPNDAYNLGFFSPSVSTGLRYAYLINQKGEGFVGISLGAQMGYNDVFTEFFEEYTVISSSDDKYYYFIKPQLGVRRELKKRKRKQVISYEYGAYFRFNFNGLGRAEFIHNNYTEILEPKGHVVGMFFKILIPSSTTKVKIKPKERKKKTPPATIFNPRFL